MATHHQFESRVIDSETVEILLSQGKWARIDREDLDRVARHHWTCVTNSNQHPYAYCRLKILGKGDKIHVAMYMLQRFVLNLGIRGVRGEKVYFRDGDSLNCRKNNLIQFTQNRRLKVG